jgi:tyrosinase
VIQQIIASHAQDVAKGYSGPLSSVYQAAADNLRLPYWDWASIPQMPDVVSEETITITTANGDRVVDNPLFAYKFNPSQNLGGFMANLPQTVRDATASVNTNLANNNLMMRTVGQIRKHNERSADGFLSGKQWSNRQTTIHLRPQQPMELQWKASTMPSIAQ